VRGASPVTDVGEERVGGDGVVDGDGEAAQRQQPGGVVRRYVKRRAQLSSAGIYIPRTISTGL